MLVKKEIIINANVKRVWRIFSRLEEWPKWGGYIIRTKWLSKTKWKRGAMLKQTIKGFDIMKEYTSISKIIEAKSHNLVIWTGTGLLVRGIHTIKFEKIDNTRKNQRFSRYRKSKGFSCKTKVSNIEQLKGPLAPIIAPFVKDKFEIYFEQFLEGLKREAEK